MNPPPSHAPASPPNGPWPYYGWVMVVVAAVLMALTLPGRTHGLGLITKRVLEDLHLSQSDFAWINFWATLAGALFCMPCGWLIDRLGVRAVLGAVLLLLGVSTMWLTSAADSASLLVGITLVRGFGQSMLSVLSITLVARWFGRNLGPAMGVYAVAMTLLMVALTLGAGSLVSAEGWRHAWWTLGGITLAAALPLVIITRNQPRHDRGEFAAAGASQPLEQGYPLTAALATRCFWVFALSISFFGLATAGLSLFQQLILEERGFDEATYQRLLGVGLLVGLASNLACGVISRWVPLPRMLAAALLLLAGGWVLFPLVTTLPQVYAYTISQSAAGGVLSVLFFAVWGRAYGRRQLGRIQGAAQMLTVLASALGPGCVAWAQEATGSYAPAFWGLAAVAVAFAVVAVGTRLPDPAAAPVASARSPEQLPIATAEV